MDYRTLGGSGCAVSRLCLGTMTFGSETDEPGAHRQLDRFVEAGGTFVDTADVAEIRALAATGLLDGVTTNPSLIDKSGRRILDVIAEMALACITRTGG